MWLLYVEANKGLQDVEVIISMVNVDKVNPQNAVIMGESAVYGGREVRKDAIKVENMRMGEGISFAEALKKVKQTPKVSI